MADKRIEVAALTGRVREAASLDRVFVHDFVLDCEIGVYTHEKGVTQRVRFSVDVDLLPASEALDDKIERALDYYRAAIAKLPANDRRAQRPGLVLAAIYQKTLDEIRRDGCRVLTQRVSLTPIRKLWISWWIWVKH